MKQIQIISANLEGTNLVSVKRRHCLTEKERKVVRALKLETKGKGKKANLRQEGKLCPNSGKSV